MRRWAASVLAVFFVAVVLTRAGATKVAEEEVLRPTLAASTGACGTERWSVKTGTDADVGKIDLTGETPTSISSLSSTAKPASLPDNNRIAPTETTVYSIAATLTEFKLEDDSDYHLVIDDGQGHTMIVEIPDPACVSPASPIRSRSEAARSAFDAKFAATTSFKMTSTPVTVTGVGFFDYLHGQTGVAPNGIELHPLLSLSFPNSSVIPITRLSGADRYATAAAVSQATFPANAPVAIIATGENYPDALAGGPAAAKHAGPILLTWRDVLPRITADELSRLQPAEIIVLGGVSAVSDAVTAELQGYTTGSVMRVAGGNRYETAAKLSSATFASAVPVTYVASGSSFPDALAGGPPAGRSGGPVLLVTPNSIPSATADELSRLAPNTIVVLGGPEAVSTAVEDQLHSYASTVGRSAGVDRYATSVAVSVNAFSPGVAKVFLATGINFPDALAGGPAGARAPGPLLLVRQNCVPAAVNTEIDRLGPRQLVILGGQSAVGTGVETRTPCSTAPPPTPPPTGATCSATMDNSNPAQYSTARVLVASTLPNSGVTAVAHYKTTTTTKTGTTDGSGNSSIAFSIGGATVGYRVVVDVSVGASATCQTGFTPR